MATSSSATPSEARRIRVLLASASPRLSPPSSFRVGELRILSQPGVQRPALLLAEAESETAVVETLVIARGIEDALDGRGMVTIWLRDALSPPTLASGEYAYVGVIVYGLTEGLFQTLRGLLPDLPVRPAAMLLRSQQDTFVRLPPPPPPHSAGTSLILTQEVLGLNKLDEAVSDKVCFKAKIVDRGGGVVEIAVVGSVKPIGIRRSGSGVESLLRDTDAASDNRLWHSWRGVETGWARLRVGDVFFPWVSRGPAGTDTFVLEDSLRFTLWRCPLPGPPHASDAPNGVAAAAPEDADPHMDGAPLADDGPASKRQRV